MDIVPVRLLPPPLVVVEYVRVRGGDVGVWVWVGYDLLGGVAVFVRVTRLL